MSKQLFKFTERDTIEGYYEAELHTLPEFGDTKIGAMVQIKKPFPYPESKENGIKDMINDFFNQVISEKFWVTEKNGIGFSINEFTEIIDVFKVTNNA